MKVRPYGLLGREEMTWFGFPYPFYLHVKEADYQSRHILWPFVNWVEGEGGQKNAWEDAIVKDLIGHVDATYRTVARREGREYEPASALPERIRGEREAGVGSAECGMGGWEGEEGRMGRGRP